VVAYLGRVHPRAVCGGFLDVADHGSASSSSR
jgi:hypothetical protein